MGPNSFLLIEDDFCLSFVQVIVKFIVVSQIESHFISVGAKFYLFYLFGELLRVVFNFAQQLVLILPRSLPTKPR